MCRPVTLHSHWWCFSVKHNCRTQAVGGPENGGEKSKGAVRAGFWRPPEAPVEFGLALLAMGSSLGGVVFQQLTLAADDSGVILRG